MIEKTFQDQIFDHITERRIQNYKLEFINQLRKRILMKKILKSFKMRNELDLKRSILVELRVNAMSSLRHKNMIKNVIEDVNYDQATDLL
jgi:hypothetical protein